jgi:hypothetical protein
MIETLESRQFLSATLAGEAVAPRDDAPTVESKATLTVRKAGGGQQEYLVVTMSDVLISSYS